MLDPAPLARVVRELAAEGRTVNFDGYAFRSIALRHFMPPKIPAPLFAARSGLIGTRFVPPNRPIASLYVATEAETAHREGNQPYYLASRMPGLAPSNLGPPEEVVIIGVRVRIGALLDLRSRAIMDRLETTPNELLSPWKTVLDAPTQRLGEALYEEGAFEGLVYNSAQNPGGSCLVIFPDRLDPISSIEFRSRTPGVPDARLAGPP
jgi:hypothetical protein